MERVKHTLTYIAKGVQWRNLALFSLGVGSILLLAVQLAYPADRTIPYATTEGIAVGGLNREAAAERIKSAYDEAQLAMYFGEAERPYRTPELKELGVAVTTDEAVDEVMYGWWLRLVPSSIWWGHLLTGDTAATATLPSEKVQAYVVQELGESCRVEPTNASIAIEDDKLQLVPSANGGECESEEVITALQGATVTASETNTIRLPVEEITPAVGDAEARQLMETIEGQLASDVRLVFDEESVVLNGAMVRPWLVFEAEGDKLVTKIDSEKSKQTLDERAGGVVAVKAGEVTIVTRDFTELSRHGGEDGRTIDIAGTSGNIATYLMGQSDEAAIATKVVPAKKHYKRSYTPTSTGLSALSQHYAEDNAGVYGVSLVELSGDRRSGGFNQTKKFTTASTYKVYVAYSTLRRVEDKTLKWSDEIAGGRDLAKCFDDMIVLSDNPCAEALVKKIGYNALHADVQALGLTNTSFIDTESFKTSAGDLTSFMQRLETKDLPISKDSRSRFIAALKRNVYRNGIPAGTSGTVADKVGFLEGLLHDTAIVYDSNGTYILTILTDGSTWGNIASLTKEIEKLRAR